LTTGQSAALPPIPGEDFSIGNYKPDAAERLAQTGKVVGMTGCGLALLFWIIIPLGFLLIAIAATSSTGFAAVAFTLGLIVAFIFWVWRRTAR
jgi:ABC-type multidrug transport system fused ATPase/permease subunit